MYLTQFEINGRRREARRLLGSPQAMHAAVMAAFPPGADAGRVLWRVDPGEHGVQTLYLVSREAPDLMHLVEQAGWETLTWRTADYDGLLGRLMSGQVWRFRLMANPTKAVRQDSEVPGGEGGRSKRFAHVTAAQQLEWFLSRTVGWGFDVPEGSVDGEPAALVVAREIRTFQRKGRTVTVSTATFEGLLQVRDPDVLRMALTGGIGPAKAYGCGLLTLAPVD